MAIGVWIADLEALSQPRPMNFASQARWVWERERAISFHPIVGPTEVISGGTWQA